MCVDFQFKLSGVTNMRQEFTVWQIKSHFSIVCRFSLFSLILLILLLLKPFDDGLVQPLPHRLPGVGYARPSKPCRWREKWLHHGGDVCVIVFS
jgi:hypothetical protein